MGKAEILGHLGSGQYHIRLLYNDQRARDEIARLEKKIEKINSQLWDLADQIDTAENELASAEDAYNQAIKDWEEARGTENEDEEWQDLKEAQEKFLQAQYELAGLLRKRRIWKAERTAAYQRIDLIERNLPSDPEIYAWCADLSTNLSGEVGTIELPGLEQEHIQIRPGYQDGAAYDPERDGQVTPLISQTPAQAFYNFAVLPGIQKWWPRYRTGQIVALSRDNDTCDVELDPAQSSAQDIFVNYKQELQDVPIEYMRCDSDAFEPGDKVVIEFDANSWERAKVIGFVHEPQPCAPAVIKLLLNGNECTQSHLIYLWNEKEGDYVGGGVGFSTDAKGIAVIKDSDLKEEIQDNADKIYPVLDDERGRLFTYYRKVDPEEEPDAIGIYSGVRDIPNRGGDRQQWKMGADFNLGDEYKQFGNFDGGDLKFHVKKVDKKQMETPWSELDTATVKDFEGVEHLAVLATFWDLAVIQHSMEQYIDPAEGNIQDYKEVKSDERARFNLDKVQPFTNFRNPLTNYGDKYIIIEVKDGIKLSKFKVNNTHPKSDYDAAYMVYTEELVDDVWELTFLDSSSFEINGNTTGYLGTGNIDQDFVCKYFAIGKDGWYGDWAAGDFIYFEVSICKYSVEVYTLDYQDNPDEYLWPQPFHTWLTNGASNPFYVVVREDYDLYADWPDKDYTKRYMTIFPYPFKGVWKSGDRIEFILRDHRTGPIIRLCQGAFPAMQQTISWMDLADMFVHPANMEFPSSGRDSSSGIEVPAQTYNPMPYMCEYNMYDEPYDIFRYHSPTYDQYLGYLACGSDHVYRVLGEGWGAGESFIEEDNRFELDLTSKAGDVDDILIFSDEKGQNVVVPDGMHLKASVYVDIYKYDFEKRKKVAIIVESNPPYCDAEEGYEIAESPFPYILTDTIERIVDHGTETWDIKPVDTPVERI